MQPRIINCSDSAAKRRTYEFEPTVYRSAFCSGAFTVSGLTMKHLFLIIGIVSLGFNARCIAQWVSDPAADKHIRDGINHVYNLSFDSAQTDFQYVSRTLPDHPAGYFFEAMVEWWHIVIDPDDQSRDERFTSLLDRTIGLCDARLEKNEDDLTALFFKGGSLGFLGRLAAYREDWIKAANDGRAALPIVQRAHTLAPDNYDVLLGIGIYNYYAEVIPDQYPIVKPLMIFFPRGDKLLGISQLKSAAAHAAYASTESAYFLLQLEFNYEKRYDDALQLASGLAGRYPDNPLFQRYVGRCQAALGRWEEMNATFSDIQRRVKEKRTGYLPATEREAQFYLGLHEMNIKHYDESLRHFYRCDELSRSLDKSGPTGFMVMVNLKIGMVYDLQSKRDLAISQYNKVMNMTEYQDSRAQAERFLKKPYRSE